MSDRLKEAGSLSLPAWQEILTDTARALRFYSRLPIPVLPWEGDPHGPPDSGRIARVLPLAGLLLGLLPALVLAASLGLGLGEWMSAILSVATATVTTGAFHEDGLADTADSFGGATPERRLAIMRDSLIGSFGSSALVLGFSLRIAALATLALRADVTAVAGAILLIASLSRVAGLIPLVFLPPARPDGAAKAVGRPGRENFWMSAALAGILTLLIGLGAGLPPSGLALMLLFAGLSGIALAWLAARHIQGGTGDIAGAAQQVAEIAALIGLLIVLRP
jgi:adenosylcobinamide-GDP ribazoletransferase